MKTIREWFEELPEPLRSAALEDAVRTRPARRLGEIASTLSYAINRGITWWECTTDWSEIHRRVVFHQQDQSKMRASVTTLPRE